MFMSNKFVIVFIALAGLMQGCGATRELEIRRSVMADTALTEEVRRAIDRKDLLQGMTQNEVIASWGLPCKWCSGTRKNPGGDIWEYNITAFGPDSVLNITDLLGEATAIYLYFDKDGKLRHWSNRDKS